MHAIRTLTALSLAMIGLAACSTSGSVDTSGELNRENFTTRIAHAMVEAGSVNVSMEAVMGENTMTSTADVAFHGDRLDTSATSSVNGTASSEALVVDNIMYIKGLSDNKYVKVDLADPPPGPLATLLTGTTDSMDPRTNFKSLDGAITSFERIGEPEEVDGVKVQRYKVGIDPAKALTTSPLAGLPQPDESSAMYWIAEDDLVYKVVTEAGEVETTTTYSSWGADLKIVAPSADEIDEDFDFDRG